MRRTNVFTVVRAGVLAAALLALAAAPRAYAQEHQAPYVIGTSYDLHSEVLGEDRRVIVHLPEGYEAGQQHYPVMYLLDGDGHFHHTTGITQFLAQQGRMPAMIVVAIPNTDRTRDLTPYPDPQFAEQMPTAGGADNFLRFLSDELIPWVDREFRTAPYRVLVGHSFGGLFAVHALLTRPETFDGYVSISPSLWWNDRAPVEQAEATIAEQPWGGRFFYMTMGNEGGDMLPAAAAFASVFKASAPEGFEWQFHWMDDETHGSIPHRTTYDALEWMFTGYRIPGLLADLGLEGIKAHFAAISDTYFEMDIPEGVINQLGYQHLGRGEVAEAIEAFQFNVEMYPGSPNVYDSLGDGYDAAGDDALALESYEKAYRMASETDHPNVGIYRGNFERLSQKVAAQR